METKREKELSKILDNVKREKDTLFYVYSAHEEDNRAQGVRVEFCGDDAVLSFALSHLLSNFGKCEKDSAEYNLCRAIFAAIYNHITSCEDSELLALFVRTLTDLMQEALEDNLKSKVEEIFDKMRSQSNKNRRRGGRRNKRNKE